MEAIKNYLETMFATLPNTNEVLKAKKELSQMMEDKYMELKEEGKTENEAIGTVISEFGNLDEVANVLGIDSYVKNQTPINATFLTLEETKEYMKCSYKRATSIALGVLLCILSPVPVIIASTLNSFAESIGISFLFLFIAAAVGLFIYSGQALYKFRFMKAKPYMLDYSTSEYVRTQEENYHTTHVLLLTLGIGLCILCVLPAILFSNSILVLEDLIAVFVISIAALGVFIIVLTCCKNTTFERLLTLNPDGTIGSNYQTNVRRPYENAVVNAIMSVYWPTVTCVYLCYSFFTFHWHLSWIIWPIAAIIHTLLASIFPKRKDF